MACRLISLRWAEVSTWAPPPDTLAFLPTGNTPAMLCVLGAHHAYA